MSTNIEQLREALLGTLADLRNRDQPMEPDRARAIAQVAGVLVDSARVEVEFIKATGADAAQFFTPALPKPPLKPGEDHRRHRLPG